MGWGGLSWRAKEGDGTYHTASQSSSQKREPKEEHKARLPGDPVTTIAEAVGLETRLLDGIDHKHAQRGADSRNPVHELDVHGRAIQGTVGKGGGVDKEEEAQRELDTENIVGLAGARF